MFRKGLNLPAGHSCSASLLRIPYDFDRTRCRGWSRKVVLCL